MPNLQKMAATVGAKKSRRTIKISAARQAAEKRNARRAQRRAGKTGGDSRRLSERDV